jgi:SAM-dependent methyltransferase
MGALKAALMRQFGHPTGPLGQLAGVVMATRRSNRVRSRWTIDQLDIQPDDQVLEIGYGPGLAIAHAARRATAGRVVGVDRSEVMRRQAARRNRIGLARGRVSLRVGTIDSIEIDRPFTKALAVNVFMFWPDPVAVLRRLSDRLAPGATVALTMQPRGGVTNADVVAVGERMAAALRSAGFTDIDTRTLPLKPVDAVCALGHRPPAVA